MLKKRVLTAAFWTYLFVFIAVPLGLLIRLMYARALSPEEFGLFYAAFGFLTFLSIFNDLGLSESLVYFLPRFIAKKKFQNARDATIMALGTQLITAVLTALVLWFVAPFLAESYFRNPVALPVLRSFLLFFLFYNVANTIMRAFQGLQKDRYYASLDPARLILVFLFSILAILLGGDIIWLSLSWGLGSLLISLFYGAALWKQIGGLSVGDFSLFKNMLGYASGVLIGNSASIILTRMDIIILTIFTDVANVGYYTIGLAMVRVFTTVMSPVTRFLYPLVSELHHDARVVELRSMLNLLFKYSLLVCLPFIILFIQFRDAIIRTFFGADYLAAAIPMFILSAGAIFEILYMYLFTYLGGMGAISKRARFVVITSVINLVLALVLVPFYGMLGTAISTVLAWFLLFLLCLLQVQKEIQFRLLEAYVFRIALVSALFLLCTTTIRKLVVAPLALEASIVLLFSYTVYVSACFLTRIVTIQELTELVKGLIRG